MERGHQEGSEEKTVDDWQRSSYITGVPNPQAADRYPAATC